MAVWVESSWWDISHLCVKIC